MIEIKKEKQIYHCLSTHALYIYLPHALYIYLPSTENTQAVWQPTNRASGNIQNTQISESVLISKG